jgi:hypothetical protein
VYENVTGRENNRTGNLDPFAYDLATGRTIEFSFGSVMQALYVVYGVDVAFTEIACPFFAQFLLDTHILAFLYFLCSYVSNKADALSKETGKSITDFHRRREPGICRGTCRDPREDMHNIRYCKQANLPDNQWFAGRGLRTE